MNIDPFNEFEDPDIWEVLEEVCFFEFLYNLIMRNFYKFTEINLFKDNSGSLDFLISKSLNEIKPLSLFLFQLITLWSGQQLCYAS